MKKLSYILLTLVFLSCKTDKKDVYQEYNGEMIKVEFDNSKTDSTFTGFGGEYYQNGNLKSLSYFKNGQPADTIFYYYENGKVKEKGLVKNGFQTDWWIYFREDGSIKEKSEYLTLSDSLYKNQSIYFDQNGKIEYENSTYLKLKIPDTIYFGRNRAYLDYYSNQKVYKTLFKVVVENEYSENEKQLDTFYIDDDKFLFGIYAYKKGNLKVKGHVIEKLYDIKNIGNDSAIGTVSNHKKYFEKEIYVSDKNN